jgi:hypothetical protein
MNIVQLTRSDYDCQENFYFKAPEGVTGNDFKVLCNKLLKDAIQEILSNNGHSYEWTVDKEMPFYIGWDGIIRTLAHKILPKHGYELIKFPTAAYCGTGIIRNKEYDDEYNLLSDDDLQTIIQHNKKVEKKPLRKKKQ